VDRSDERIRSAGRARTDLCHGRHPFPGSHGAALQHRSPHAARIRHPSEFTRQFFPHGIATDGSSVWTANFGITAAAGSVSSINPDTGATFTSSTGFKDPIGIVYDGAHIWVTSYSDGVPHWICGFGCCSNALS